MRFPSVENRRAWPDHPVPLLGSQPVSSKLDVLFPCSGPASGLMHGFLWNALPLF